MEPITILTRKVQLPLKPEFTGFRGDESGPCTLEGQWLGRRGRGRGGRQLTCGAAASVTALRLNSSFQNLLPEQPTNKRFIPGYLQRWKLLTRPRERATGSEQNAAWF